VGNDAIENLDGDEPHVEHGRNREHGAEILRCVRMSMVVSVRVVHAAV
jgi:hypothetical protein